MSNEEVRQDAWLNGDYIRRDQLVLHMDDLGFLQGATAVERIRTWNQQIPLIDRHLYRFQSSAAALHLTDIPDAGELETIIQTLLSQSRSQNPVDDIGFTIFATAGRLSTRLPTVAVHWHRLDQNRLQSYWDHGQPLVITDIVQPPPECWPREIKVRSRLHYYLADAHARGQDTNAIGALRDTDGSITEASTCNIFVAVENKLIAPPRGRVLPGIMGETVTKLAIEHGYHLERRPLLPQDLEKHSVWLTGSEGGLWFANKVNGQAKSADQRLRELQKSLHDHLTSGIGFQPVKVE